MSKSSNININKQGVLSFLCAGVVAFTLSGCHEGVINSVSLDELMTNEEVKDLTLYDELDENYLNQAVESTLRSGEKLDNYISLLERIKNLDLSGAEDLKPLSDEEYQRLENLKSEEYEQIFIDYNTIDSSYSSMDKRVDAVKKLYYLNQHCQSWINENGDRVAVNLLIDAVKTNVAVELNIPVEEYNSISIDPRPDTYELNTPYGITINDNKYIIDSTDIGLWDSINYIYCLQNPELFSNEDLNGFEKDPLYKYKRAVDLAKTTISVGSNLKDGNKLEPQNSFDYIKKFNL